MIEKEARNGIAFLRFAHGTASALDSEFLLEIASTIRKVAKSDATACVLTGTGNIFSAGVDLKRFVDGGVTYLDTFMPALDAAFMALFSFPRPLIAACNGHAIAGGCVILSCCDLRLVANGSGRIGVPELLVGVPFPLLPLEIMRFVVPSDKLQQVLYEGKNYKVDQALAIGLCDEIVEPDELETRAFAAAAQLAAYPTEAFTFNKRQIRRPTMETVATFGQADNKEVLSLWKSEACQQAVNDYVNKTL